jgi:hypothetical protein
MGIDGRGVRGVQALRHQDRDHVLLGIRRPGCATAIQAKPSGYRRHVVAPADQHDESWYFAALDVAAHHVMHAAEPHLGQSSGAHRRSPPFRLIRPMAGWPGGARNPLVRQCGGFQGRILLAHQHQGRHGQGRQRLARQQEDRRRVENEPLLSRCCRATPTPLPRHPGRAPHPRGSHGRPPMADPAPHDIRQRPLG